MFVVASTSFGEHTFLKIFDRGRYGKKYGLVRDSTQATTFANKLSAAISAGRAGSIIMRAFEAVELEPKTARRKELIALSQGGPHLVSPATVAA